MNRRPFVQLKSLKKRFLAYLKRVVREVYWMSAALLLAASLVAQEV